MATATSLAHRLFAELFTLGKSPGQSPGHSPSPRHGYPHCGGFAPGAPRRAWALVSVPIWGLPLSRPLPVFGLAGRYPANYLIGRRPILGRQSLSGMGEFHHPFPMGDYPQFPGVIPHPRVGCRRVTQLFGGRENPPCLPWVSRTGIAVASRRINGNSAGTPAAGLSPRSTTAKAASSVELSPISSIPHICLRGRTSKITYHLEDTAAEGILN